MKIALLSDLHLSVQPMEPPPTDADVVVVDEASMIDLALMTHLVEAIPPHSRVIFLGDQNQLTHAALDQPLCLSHQGLDGA